MRRRSPDSRGRRTTRIERTSSARASAAHSTDTPAAPYTRTTSSCALETTDAGAAERLINCRTTAVETTCSMARSCAGRGVRSITRDVTGRASDGDGPGRFGEPPRDLFGGVVSGKEALDLQLL